MPTPSEMRAAAALYRAQAAQRRVAARLEEARKAERPFSDVEEAFNREFGPDGLRLSFPSEGTVVGGDVWRFEGRFAYRVQSGFDRDHSIRVEGDKVIVTTVGCTSEENVAATLEIPIGVVRAVLSVGSVAQRLAVDDPSLPSVDISPDMRRELEEKVGGGATQEAQEILTAWRSSGGPIESILPFLVTTILSYRGQVKRILDKAKDLRSKADECEDVHSLEQLVYAFCDEVGEDHATPFPCCDKMRDSQGDYPDRIPSDARFCPWCGVRRGV
jgi:hypothetical protein